MAKDFTKTKEKISILSDAKKERALKLLEKVVFMDNQLEELQKILKNKGWCEEYKNGANQYGLKTSSEATVYISLSKNYVTALKQLESMLIEDREEREKSGEALLSFIQKGKM